jgi:hypothetical protein
VSIVVLSGLRNGRKIRYIARTTRRRCAMGVLDDRSAQVRNGKWARVHPAKPNTFDCNKQNLTEIKVNQG